jgi:hypothetical protein
MNAGGSCHGEVLDIVLFTWQTYNDEKAKSGNHYVGRDSNRSPSEYKSEALTVMALDEMWNQ